MEETELDAGELRQLLKSAARPRVKELLSAELLRLESLRLAAPRPAPSAVSEAGPNAVPEPPSASFEELTRYAWADEGACAKVYISLPEVGLLPREAVSVDFSPRGFDLKVRGYRGKNLRLALPRLFAKLDCAGSALTVKPGDIVLRLRKAEAGPWSKLVGAEGQPGEGKDPAKDLMGLMRNMYDDGDDNMKRTMAEAFSKAHTEKRN